MTQDDEALRAAARAWLEATDRLDAAVRADGEAADVMTLADHATLARMQFHRVLVELGWQPPARSKSDASR